MDTNNTVPDKIATETKPAEAASPDRKTEAVRAVEPVTPAPQVNPSDDSGLTLEDSRLTEEVWGKVMKKMELPLQSKLSKASFKLEGDKLVLTLNGGYSVFADSIKKNEKLIMKIFSDELGKKISLEVGTAKKKVVRKKDLKEQLMADPAIKEVLELFDGRIVDVAPIPENNK